MKEALPGLLVGPRVSHPSEEGPGQAGWLAVLRRVTGQARRVHQICGRLMEESADAIYRSRARQQLQQLQQGLAAAAESCFVWRMLQPALVCCYTFLQGSYRAKITECAVL